MTSRIRDTASLKGLETLYQVGSVGHLADGQLLEWFLAGRGAGETAEAGFTALVDRHGPMVLRVCRQILGDTHDAQDAFQATFLILVRKAGSVRNRESVASWLHGIARRVALRAKSDRIRRRAYEQRGAEMAARTDVRSPGEPECWPELHEEVSRLPERYRESVVLCYLEGLTTEEAARRLGCPQGTILSRLSRARDRLRDRLTRRGLAVPVGLTAAGLPAGTAQAAAVPPSLSHSVVQAALRLAASQTATAIVPASVAGPIRRVLRTAFVSRPEMAAAALAAVVALIVGAGAIMLREPTALIRPAEAVDEPRPTPSALDQDIGRIRALFTPGLIPAELRWTEVSTADRLKVLDLIAARLKANFEKIHTWRGAYAYRERQPIWMPWYPEHDFQKQPPLRRSGRELRSDGRIQFAIDMAADAIYRDRRIIEAVLVKDGTDEVVSVPKSRPLETRTIVNKEESIEFRPDERATHPLPPPLAESRDRRIAYRRHRAAVDDSSGSLIDPRTFLRMFDKNQISAVNPERVAKALRSFKGDKSREMIEEGSRLIQADGPGGRWYGFELKLPWGDGSSSWMIIFWSPEAGLNPVGFATTIGTPARKVQLKYEWRWKMIDGILVPSTVRESPASSRTIDREAKLVDCVLNRPLDSHQFDHRGLGMADGDLIIDEVKRAGYIIKAGELVKLADFVDPRNR